MIQVSYEISKEDYEKAKDNPYNIISDSVKMGYGCCDAEVKEIDGHYYLSYFRGTSCD